MRFLALTTAALFGATAAVAVRPLIVADTDYSTLPPDAASLEKLLTEKKYSLSKALEAAQKKTGGSATEARLNVDTGVVDVQCIAQGAAHKVSVDAVSGEVKSDVSLPAFVMPGDPMTGPLVSTPSGLRYVDLKAGTGDQPNPTSKVKVHYTGWLVDGKKFDSSVDRGQPVEFPLNGVIKGWTEGVGSMKVGGKRKLVIPGGLAYGPGGRQPVIPGNAMLIFDVELLEITAK